jgi:hypothetical protein
VTTPKPTVRPKGLTCVPVCVPDGVAVRELLAERLALAVTDTEDVAVCNAGQGRTLW